MAFIIDTFVFPAPKQRYTGLDLAKKCNGKDTHLLWVPTLEETNPIPCLFFENKKARYSIIFSHGNASDLYSLFSDYSYLSEQIQMNIFAYEYPGYGCFKGKSCGESINKVISIVNTFVVNKLKVPQDRIILIGQSLGTGPSCHLAAKLSRDKTPPAFLLLVSPYTSIPDMVLNVSGWKIIKWLSSEHWNNKEVIPYVTCPTLFVHGKDDDLIPHSSSITLYNSCKTVKKLVSLKDRGHNDIEYHKIIFALMTFILGTVGESNFSKMKKLSIVVPNKYTHEPIKITREDCYGFVWSS